VKIVLDTNVLLAAFAAHGLCEAVYEACLVHHEIVLSQHILDEVRRHLPRMLKLPASVADEIVATIESHATIVTPAAVATDACRDKADLPVLGTLLAGQADCLVTGDDDLLSLGTFEGKPILTPRGLHELIS